MACCNDCNDTGGNCGDKNMSSLMRVQNRGYGAADTYCPPGTVRSGNSCYATSRDRIYAPTSGGQVNTGQSSAASIVNAIAGAWQSTIPLLLNRNSANPYQNQGRYQGGEIPAGYQVRPDGSLEQIGSGASGIVKQFGDSVKKNPTLWLIAAGAAFLLFVSPPKLARRNPVSSLLSLKNPLIKANPKRRTKKRGRKAKR